jgi:hypothetical protein
VVTQGAPRTLLTVDAVPCEQGSRGVSVDHLNAKLLLSFRSYLRAGGLPESVFRVDTLKTEAPFDGNVPGIAGEYQVLESGLRFIPYFPFEPGMSYQATFDPSPLNLTDRIVRFERADALTLEFSVPKDSKTSPAEVERVFPSSDHLPENLLRFYVIFANPMQRGHVGTEISLLGPDGQPAADVLYRSPIELWDRSMKCLTILLDPGRLKRGVGPNRALGPPLKPGQTYTLVIGAGMTDLFHNPLSKPIYKHFHVIEAVRETIAIKAWKSGLPITQSRQPLTISFPGSLDWALLSRCITIVSGSQQSINGRIKIEDCERRWIFTPALPWNSDTYEVRVASDIEDVCGNSVSAPFDRPLRLGDNWGNEEATHSIPFELQQVS